MFNDDTANIRKSNFASRLLNRAMEERAKADKQSNLCVKDAEEYVQGSVREERQEAAARK